MSSPDQFQQEYSEPKTQPRPAFTHILAALTVLILLIAAAVIGDQQATQAENKNVQGFGPGLLEQIDVGSVYQQAAFRQPDLLPVLGSSEMVATVTPYRAFTLFSTFPTGFDVFDIANGGDTSINMAQDLASLGPVLRGRKVVISFTPSMFTQYETGPIPYAGNFSIFHASDLIFSPYLKIEVKRDAAKRLAEYPGTLDGNFLLQAAIYDLSQNTPQNDYFYYVLYPFGSLDNFLSRLKDHYAVLQFLGKNKGSPVKHQARVINWQQMVASAEAEEKRKTDNNPYGLDNQLWSSHGNVGFAFRPPGTADQAYISRLNNSKEWKDFNLLLEILKELGAKPLILSRPINGTLYTAAGISSKAQQTYYNRLKTLVASYNFPLVDFQQYTDDRYFNVDFPSHPSPKGWVLVDQVLDAFYHNQPLSLPAQNPVK